MVDSPTEKLQPNVIEATEAHEAPGHLTIVAKVHQLCNMGCPSCYVYEGEDTSWQRQPAVMEPEVVKTLGNRMREYHERHPDTNFKLILHGGEPLLVGHRRLASMLGTWRDCLPEDKLDISMQTNATRLDERFLDILQDHGVNSVSVSLDGYKEANDRSRPYRNGRSTYNDTLRGIELLKQEPYRHMFSGLLAVIDLRNDPEAVYEALAEHAPPRIDLLLPHHTWKDLPPNPTGSGTPYGDWMARVFDTWYRERPQRTNIRTFQSIINGLFGRSTGVESIGLTPVNELVVHTGGAVGEVDTLAVAVDGIADGDMNIRRTSLEAALDSPPVLARRLGREALKRQLSSVCNGGDDSDACPIVDTCGGGYLPHRYSEERGFDNPSVYCLDLARIIGHVAGAVGEDSMVVGRVRALIAREYRLRTGISEGVAF